MHPLPKLLFIALFTSLLLLSCSGMNRNVPVLAKGEPVTAPGDSIWIIFQDSRNNYWFGSNGQGVYRYDGKTTIRFSVKDGLCNDSIRDIQEDAAGRLYFATRSGISQFDGQHFNTLVPVKGGDWKLEAGDLWFPGNQEYNGTFRYDGEQLYYLALPKSDLHEDFYSDLPNPPFDPYHVYSTYRDSKGDMWFGSSSFGVCRYDGTAFKWISVREELPNDPVRSIIEDQQGNFLFGNSSSGVYAYDGYWLTNLRKEKGIGRVTGMTEDVPVSYNSIVKDDNDHFWIATYRSGVWFYDGKKATHYPIMDGSKVVTLISVYKDRKGVLWLGTEKKGVYRFNGKTFEPFRP
jgi:ligand-binding sensor domain-containing protein